MWPHKLAILVFMLFVKLENNSREDNLDSSCLSHFRIYNIITEISIYASLLGSASEYLDCFPTF